METNVRRGDRQMMKEANSMTKADLIEKLAEKETEISRETSAKRLADLKLEVERIKRDIRKWS
ncbi:hypothetical protein [Rhizobium leguminosarum]|uniref:hypothetical protein n=1 Tax=Rhizobium leguminosarum TaxID=384 RepID=UPI001A8F95F6|nr:hypothetical protein [Rhizobium leguminosarum]